MQGGLNLLGGGGGGSGSNTSESLMLKVEKEYVEGSSYPAEESDELELGLGLSLGGGGGKGKVSAWGECGRILTAKDFPSAVVTQVNRANTSSPVATAAAVSGTKRTADSVSHEGGSSPPGIRFIFILHRLFMLYVFVICIHVCIFLCMFAKKIEGKSIEYVYMHVFYLGTRLRIKLLVSLFS